MAEPANYINHFAVNIDMSWSMTRHQKALIEAWDAYVEHLAARSREQDQETRITVYTFSSRGQEKCLFYDKDVLRMPSIRDLYRPHGNTALIDCTMKSIADLEKTADLYGEHAYMVTDLSDGEENDSARFRPYDLAARIGALPANWTAAAFAPNASAVYELKKCGFPADNISVWDTDSATGMEKVGAMMRDVSDMFMAGRSKGVHGYNSRPGGLFRMRDFTAADVTAALSALTPGAYLLLSVTHDGPIREFVEAAGMTYVKGSAFYQLTKSVKVQSYKDVAVEHQGRIYTGDHARQVLGLPDYEVTVQPDHKPGMTIFFQSTSVNRKLFGGTRLLVLR